MMAKRIAVALLMVAVLASPLAAQPTRPKPTPLQNAVRRAGIELTRPAKNERTVQPIVRRSNPPGSTSRKVFIAGAILGGLIAGAYMGSWIEGDCACDSPGMQGGIIGAPIGALVGGILAARLTR